MPEIKWNTRTNYTLTNEDHDRSVEGYLEDGRYRISNVSWGDIERNRIVHYTGDGVMYFAKWIFVK